MYYNDNNNLVMMKKTITIKVIKDTFTHISLFVLKRRVHPSPEITSLYYDVVPVSIKMMSRPGYVSTKICSAKNSGGHVVIIRWPQIYFFC